MRKAKKQKVFILVGDAHQGAHEGRKPYISMSSLNDLLEKNTSARVVLACPSDYSRGTLIVVETDRKKSK